MTSFDFFRRFSVFVIAFLFLVVLCGVATACPTCKDSLAGTDPNHAGMVRGYFWSILFMMSMPFLILAGLSTYMYWEVRKARAREAEAAEPLVATVGAGRETVEV